MVKSFSGEELKPGTFVLYGRCRGGLSFSMYLGIEAHEGTRYNYQTKKHEQVTIHRPTFLQCLTNVEYEYDSDGRYITDEQTGFLKTTSINRYFRKCSTMYGYRATPIPDEMVPEDIRKAYREVYPV